MYCQRIVLLYSIASAAFDNMFIRPSRLENPGLQNNYRELEWPAMASHLVIQSLRMSKTVVGMVELPCLINACFVNIILLRSNRQLPVRFR